MVSLNLNSEKNVSLVTPGLMHRGLESAAQKSPDHPAVLTEDERWTFAEFEWDRRRRGAALRCRPGSFACGWVRTFLSPRRRKRPPPT
jgi:non-ribosomal peptide synthetase component F